MRNTPNHLFAIAFALIAFLVISVTGIYWTKISNNTIITEQKFLLGGIVRSQASALERRLALAFTSAQILALDIEKHGGDDSHFDEYARDIQEAIGGVESLQLAPQGIIKKIYPLEGNETAIGLNILKHPQWGAVTKSAIESKELVLIGPMILVQGGEAVLSRSPIFLNRHTPNETFWGFATTVIMMKQLIDSTNLRELENDGYSYQLDRQFTHSNSHSIFFRSKQPLSESYVSTELILPSGKWTLKISRDLSVSINSRAYIGYALTFTFAVLAALFLHYMVSQPAKLRELVKEKTKALQDIAYTDPLTGLPNRRYLNDYLPKILLKNKINRQASTFVYFDLDNFKRINDTIGHDIGDRVLELIALRLNSIIQDDDKITRLGGDEFGLFLHNTTGQENITAIAKQILEAVRAPLKIDNREFALTTSLGIAQIPKDGDNLVSIMQNADMALYHAKQRGKNNFSFYHSDMKDQAILLAATEADLDHAITNQEFELYYQPLFNIRDQKIYGAEALIRWNHPERGLLFPDSFIELAESTGQIVDIGYWVIEQAIMYLAKRSSSNQTELLVHVNLSALQLADQTLVSQVSKLLKKHSVHANQLGFEVTETALLKDNELAINALQAFKDMGICIAIDDFGIGYSSLGQLKNLPVNQLKVDRSFITDIEDDPNDRKIVEAIIAMSHKLGLLVVAEGIENQTQWQMLNDFQCDFGQGYLIGRPIPEEDFTALSNRQAL
ncbi:bifunctional diguanylate cyclase/phosphodiesterase [Marinomonas epiphytica]